MQFSSHANLSMEMTNGRPLCPKCKAPMWGVHVEPAKTADDKRTFQCPRCEHSQAVRFAPESRHFLRRA
jgi:transposase-like protein